MEQNKTAQNMFNQLRRQAEELMAAKDFVKAPIDFKDPLTLIHELQTFQIELELQIEELHRSHQELMKSKICFTELYDFAPVGYISVNLQGIIINANLTLADMLLVERGNLIKQPLSDYIFFEDQDIYYCHLQDLLNSKEQLRHELRMEKTDGTLVLVQIESSIIQDESGKPDKVRTAIIDITNRKKAEKERITAHKIMEDQAKHALVGRVAGKMAHDFNNILTIIMGNTELAMFDCEDKDIFKTLKLTLDQALRGKNLTKNLVAFAKSQEPKQAFFKINEKIDLVISLLKRDLEGIEVIREEDPVPELLADSGMIEHSLVNLIQNSIHALRKTKDPRIIIRTYFHADKICFEIEDNGCGIPEEHFKNIYEPSFSLKGSRDVTNSYRIGIKGTGYGMSNVNKYIGQHKGTIVLESEPCVGTRFTISLPVIQKELTQEDKTEIQKGKIYFGKSILIVEDEQAISDVQKRILTQEPCNHNIDIAQDGQTAMELFGQNRYDCISLDYILPGNINGMDVYNHIRNTDKEIPILFISGNIEFLESIKELKQKDIYIDHLSKPCLNKDYVKRINELFEKME